MKSGKKLRILHVGNHTIPCVGGIENVIWQSAREQARMGHDVSIMVFNTCTKKEVLLPAHETKEGVSIRRVPQFGPAFYRIPPIGPLLDAARGADIVHVHGLGAWADLLSVLKPWHGTKIVVTTHGGFGHTPKRSGLKNLYRRLIQPITARNIDHFFLVSQGDYFYLKPLPADKYSVVPNGIDWAKFQSISLSRKKPNYFLFVGRLSRNKRVDNLLNAFAQVVKKIPSARLSIVGEDWDRLQSDYEKNMVEMGLSKKVFFHGKISDSALQIEYGKAGIIISASEYEGFGISVIEGMAAGCVPCVNDIPSFREFAGGGCGAVVDFSNSERAADEMVRLVHLPKSSFQSKQKQSLLFAKSYSIEGVESRHLAVYFQLLRAGGNNL